MSERFLSHHNENLTSTEFLKKYILGSDVDGVLAELGPCGVESFNKLVNANYKPEDIVVYNQLFYWAKEMGKTDAEALEINRLIWDNPDVMIKAVPIDGSVELMKWFYEKGVKPFIVTSRVSKLRDCTIAWFEKYFPFIDKDTINVGSHSDISLGEDFKISTVRSLGVNCFFEDVPKTAERVLTETKAAVVLVEHAHNSATELNHKKLFWSRRSNGIPTVRPILKGFMDKDY